MHTVMHKESNLYVFIKVCLIIVKEIVTKHLLWVVVLVLFNLKLKFKISIKCFVFLQAFNLPATLATIKERKMNKHTNNRKRRKM